MSDVQIKQHVKMGRRKGVFLLPNLFTTAGLFAGFFSIVASMQSHFMTAAISIFVALIFDGLDGRVARMIKAQSAFGAQYDSLSDMVAFGLAPALMMYNWTLSGLNHLGWHKFGWLSAFIYVACVALRLAKFNTQVEPASPLAKRYFFGMPCPAGAVCIASVVWAGTLFDFTGPYISWVYAVLVICLGLLMVSNIRYRSYKDIDLQTPVGFAVLIIVILLIALVAFRPASMLLLLSGIYVVSGPLFALQRYLRKRQD